jgi:pantoate--beta-alanine ligase
VRESDGLAMSSRNARLDTAQRAAAALIPRALDRAIADVAGGERSMTVVTERVRRTLEAQPGFGVDYVEVFDAATLRRVEEIDDHQRRAGVLRIAVATFVGDVRLIDNRDLFDV